MPEGREGIYPKELKESPESEIEKEYQRNHKQVADIFNRLMGTSMNEVVLGDSNEPYFSGDAASLYTLARVGDGDDSKVKLFKLGWGEFSLNTFEGNIKKSDRRRKNKNIIRNLPTPLFVVRQSESHLATDEIKQQMQDNPVDYISERAMLAYDKEVIFKRKYGEKKSIPEEKIRTDSVDVLIRDLRNAVINHLSTPEEFSEVLEQLPNNVEELGKLFSRYYNRTPLTEYERKIVTEEALKDDRTRKIIGIIRDLGVNNVGIAVGDKEAMESVLELKAKYDFDKKEFTI